MKAGGEGGVMCTGRCVGSSSLFGCWKDEGLNHPLIKAFCSLWDLSCHSGGYLKQDFIEGNRWDNGAQILRSISSQEPWLWWFKQENCTWLNVYRCVHLAHVCDGGEKEREWEMGSHYLWFFHTHTYVQYIYHMLTIPVLTSSQEQIWRDSSFFPKAHWIWLQNETEGLER